MQLPKIDQPKERIESVELVPFRAAVAQKADAIMTGHLAVPAFEPAAIPATVSKNILTGLLREELGFNGLVVTDAMDMQGVIALAGPTEAAIRAVEAGADVILMPVDPEASIRGIERAVRSGRISEKRINESAAKILAAKQKVGLFRSHTINLDRIADEIKDQKLEQLAQHVADEALTLVKDEKHLFPISDAQDACVVVLAEGTYPSRGRVFLREIASRGPAVKRFIVNSAMTDDELNGVAKAMGTCKSIYAAAFVTVEAYRGSVALEGGLSKFVDTLAGSSTPFGLISLGNPYLLRNFPSIGTYMATFSSSTTSEIATAKAIFGEISIQGRLPVSIPGLAKAGDGIQIMGKLTSASQTTK
jgi:beta-N-acetylhexosaminidase